MEYINETQVSPLISHVQIKVCYVGESENRNGTVITKEVAESMGAKLPGSPIVGYYNEDKKDFESHNKEVEIKDGKFRIVDTTRPYGFVPTNAKVWFQRFSDDGVEHEYLCTEGYIWTGIYKESKRVVEQGNNQSMELNDEYEKGFWTNSKNSGRQIFIISDGLIEKLCILGSDVEPCFEGSQIKAFSLSGEEFKQFRATMFSMINELKDALKGGSEEKMENENKNPLLEDEITPAPEGEFEKKKPEEEQKEDTQESETDDTKDDDEKKKKQEEEDDYACGGAGGSSARASDKKKKKEYEELTDIPEYVALQQDLEQLQSKYSALEQSNASMASELESLRTFKLAAERKDKEKMIADFYMLTDEDKKDVIEHIDNYSLDDIEAKLSIICVRNRVDFKLADEQQANNPNQQFMLNLQTEQTSVEEDDVPAWVKLVRQASKV